MARDPFIDFRERLKCDLRLQGSSFAQISEQLGVSQSAVSYVARRRNRSETIETAIANALGQTVEEVFAGIDRQVQEGRMT